MTFAECILDEFERAAPLTRRHLERIPEGKLGWRPAEKSMTAGQLGFHLASTPGFAAQVAVSDSFEVPDFVFPQPGSVAEILAALDESVAAVRAALGGVSDARLEGAVNFTKHGETVMVFDRKQMVRDIVLNHLYHHRGQMSVYLRLLGVAVPSSFGPTADEGMMAAPETATV